ELLKNSIVKISKTALIYRFHETEAGRELIFQQLESFNKKKTFR
ncbi:hypothetical protein LEP1GSC170_3804, partial [Leptospira interrogans serovar Bataviae str. HAI135]